MKPNLVFILVDDMGYGDIGAFGNPLVQTPALDALAQSGVMLRQHYSASCVCAPARAALSEFGPQSLVRDNGSFRAGKGTVFEGGIRVPAIAAWPAGLQGGRGVDELVHFTDWMPTMLDAAGIARSSELPLDGQSILPLLRGERGATSAQRFWQWNRYTPLVESNAAMRDLRRRGWGRVRQSQCPSKALPFHSDEKPHILIFNPDQWRGDVLGHLSNPAAVTPILDECVARDFVSFRGAFCQNPVCTPSRCSFMSGWYPHTRGHRTMHHMLHAERGEPNLLQILKENGYFVWWGGKNDLVPRENGFEAVCDVKYQPPPSQIPVPRDHEAWRGAPDSDNYYSFMRGALDKGDSDIYPDHDWGQILGAIEQIKNAPPHQPMCIYLPITYPHPVYAVEEPFFSLLEREKLPPRAPTPQNWNGKPSILEGISELQNLRGWDEARWTELRATYYGMCARVDHQFGMVLDALHEAGIYDDTAVFFFSDHGDFTGDYGLVEKTQNTFEDCLSRVPFLIKPPHDVPLVPRVSEALVELVDFSATVFDLLGIEPNYTSFGRSLLPLLAGKTDSHRDAVFCEGGRLQGENHCKELDSASSSNPDGLYYPRMQMQAGDGPQHLKAVMCRTRDWKYVRRLGESDELYDLQNDPQEMDNRIDDPSLASVRVQLAERMLTWFLETGDVVPFEIDKR